jgi:hypothetical protein
VDVASGQSSEVVVIARAESPPSTFTQLLSAAPTHVTRIGVHLVRTWKLTSETLENSVFWRLRLTGLSETWG